MSDNIAALDGKPFSEGSQATEFFAKWRSRCPEGFDSRVTIETVRNGYEHCTYIGRCDSTVTEVDIARLFAHPEFGCRDLRLWFEPSSSTWRFTVTRNLD